MMKTKAEKIVAIGGSVLFLFGFLMCCSGIQFPFVNPKGNLNDQLKGDFGVALPSSAVVNESYWVGSRDPEHVFKIQIAPADMKLFFESLRVEVKARDYEIQPWIPGVSLSHFGPLYRKPPWWNNPPLADAETLEINLKDKTTGNIRTHYRFLCSPSTGMTYVVWGRF